MTTVKGHSVTPPSARDVTQLLSDWSGGDQQALDHLMPLVYDKLHQLAERYMSRERPDHTLQPTALLHEAYLRLVDQPRVRWRNRAHFFGIAAEMMRRILVNYAHHHLAAKRGVGTKRISLTGIVTQKQERAIEVLELDEALTQLWQKDSQQARIVEFRFFAGLTIKETAEALVISPATVKREWRMARAWLQREIEKRLAN